MAPRVAGIPQYRERAALQSIKHRGWVPQMALYPADEAVRRGQTRRFDRGSATSRLARIAVKVVLSKVSKILRRQRAFRVGI